MSSRKAGPDLVVHALGDAGHGELRAVRLGPELVQAGLGLGRDGVEVAVRHAPAAVTLGRAGPGGRAADVEDHRRRRDEVDDLPAVDIAGEPAELRQHRRRRAVDDPSGGPHAARRALGRGRRLRHSHLAQRGGVDEGQMREVEQIVDQQLVVAADMEIGRLGPPVRVVEPVEIGDIGGVHAVGVAHPDPDEPVALDQRIGGDAGAGRDRALAGDGDARARAVELEPVIAAFDPLAQNPPHRERERAVAAAVFQRRRGSVGGPVEQDGRSQDLPREGPAGLHLVLPRGDVPGVSDEGAHGRRW